jgi:hypothetical protein
MGNSDHGTTYTYTATRFGFGNDYVDPNILLAGGPQSKVNCFEEFVNIWQEDLAGDREEVWALSGPDAVDHYIAVVV